MLLNITWACRIVATRYVKSCHVLICCWVVPKEERYRQMKRQRSSLLFLGAEFIQFLAALVILPRTILKNRINSSFSFKSSCRVLSIQSKTSSVARFWINSSSQNSSDDLCLFFCFYTVLLCMVYLSVSYRLNQRSLSFTITELSVNRLWRQNWLACTQTWQFHGKITNTSFLLPLENDLTARVNGSP